MTRRIAPVGEADAVLARLPDLLAVHAETRRNVLEDGLVDEDLKRLCALYLAEDDDVVRHAADPGCFDQREGAALAWTHAVRWQGPADDALWESLHANFTEPELVELGYFLHVTLGLMHLHRALGLPPPPLPGEHAT
jgi:hypothetical protein